MTVYSAKRPLVLASASPRRKELLGYLGISFNIVTCPEAEPKAAVGEDPASYAQRAALAKGLAVQEHLRTSCPQMYEQSVVLAADTIVVLNSAILGKPEDAADALRMLRLLKGNRHEVFTGCCLLLPHADGLKPELFHTRSAVYFWDCPDAALKAYAAGTEPLDKAGAYAVQGEGAFLVSRIEGSWSNVVGLPLAELTQHFLRLGVIEPYAPVDI